MFDIEKFVKNQSEEDREALENLVRTFAHNIQEKNILSQENTILKNQLRLLKKKLFGASSEKSKPDEPLIDGELQLFNEFELTSQECDKTAEEYSGESSLTSEETAHTAKKPGRRKLPKDLPHVVIEHDLSAKDKQCVCGVEMTCIGVQTSEEIDYVPAQLHVIEHHCKKYLCEACAKAQQKDPTVSVPSQTAKKPASLIEKSIASAGLLAHIAVAKFCDYLPLYRQEQIFKRLGLDLSRQTMSVWMLKVGAAIIPLINLMQEEILNYDVAFADETTVQVLNEDQKARTSLPQGTLGQAIAYTRQRWPCLITYLEDGRYEIDNNRTERAIKPFVMGRNNFLFSQSVDGAHTSARLYSLIETAKMHLLNPVESLKYLFTELPNCKNVSDYEALLPYNIENPDLKISI